MLSMMIFAAAVAAAEPATPSAPAAAPAAIASELAPSQLGPLQDRRGRIARFIRRGLRDGWLDRNEGRDAFRSLRAIRSQEEDWRLAGAGGLTAEQEAELGRRLHDLAQSLRWKGEREAWGHRRIH